MSYVRRLVLGVLACGSAALGATAATAEPPPDRGKPELVGTYQRVAKDLVQPDGTLRDVYDDLLVTGTKTYRLRLPQGTHLHGGTPLRVRGTLANADMEVETVETLGPAAAPAATTGTTKVLVILAHWSSPDSVTKAHAEAQVFGDDHGWFREASYGQLGLTGHATDWVKITAPTGGHCYANHWEIMDRARAAAKAQYGYDHVNYDRTMVYFPACGGDAAGAAGWAYVPGDTVWLNGYFDRRVSVHEQGHNYGLWHAHTLTCTHGGVRVTLGGSCSYTDYGDDYDAMGASSYAAHFSAPAKDQLGWLGTTRRRTIGSATATTFTLPPFEQAGAQPVAAVTGTSVATRKYWVEYRQAIGRDSALPTGATAGVLVHMRDSAVSGGGGAFLLDMTPLDSSFTTAVIPAGGSWTSPEAVRISVGALTASGAEVTVEGGVGPPTVPGVPRNVTAVGGDGSALLTWEPPASNGGATIQQYVVTRTPGGVTTTVDAANTTAVVESLTNGTEYAFTVAAKNSVGTGTASEPVTATPAAQLPSVSVTAPAEAATVGGLTTLTATATPHPVTQSPIQYVEFQVDGEVVAWDDTAPYSVEWDSSSVADGAHTVTAAAYDASWRYSTSAPVAVTVKTPRPTISLTSPLDGAVITDDVVALESSAAPAENGGAPIEWVSYHLDDDTMIGWGAMTAPYAAQWDTTTLSGTYRVYAMVTDTDGRTGVSPLATVTVDHPVPTVALTSPAEGAMVEGSALVAATATPSPVSQTPVDRVEFYVDGIYLQSDWDSPYEITWDTGSMSGPHVLTAKAYDTAGHVATSAARPVDVANPVPGVVVTSPTEGAVTSGIVTFAADATPNAASDSPVTKVVFTVDGWQEVATDTTAPYETTWNSAGLQGQHTLVAMAYDAAGQAGTSAPVTFTVPDPAPTAVLTAPADGSTVRTGTDVTLTAVGAPDVDTQSPVARAEFSVDGLVVGADYTPEDGLTVVWEDAWAGAHSITATVYDEQWYSGTSPPVTLTVADPAAAPTGVTAVAGADGTATVSWSAPADDGGSPVAGYVVTTGAVTKAAAQSPFVFTGLANGTSYRFTVAATTGAGTGTASAPSNAVTPGTKTSLSIAVTPATVAYGKAATVTGTLKAGAAVLPGRTVQLLACRPGTTTCAVAKSGTTSSTGKVTLTYVPKLHRDLKLRFLTASPYLGSASTVKAVKVSAVVSSAISKTTMARGSSATVSGYVKPAHSGTRVYLQRLTGTGWKDVTYKNQSSTGYVAFPVKPGARGTYWYRLRFPADTDHLQGVSAGRGVKVT